MERSTIFNGKIHYFYGHFPWQNVSSPEGTQGEAVGKIAAHNLVNRYT